MFFEEFEEINENLVFIGNTPEQYKSAILGLTSDDNHVVYSYNKLVDAMLKENPEWTETDAIEWIDYNTIRSLGFMGENAPMIIYDLEDTDAED
jgi:hypothetical protein